MESGFAAALLSVAVLGTFALMAGGLWLLVKRKDRKKGLLMLVAAVVLAVNVMIWALPMPGK